MGRFSGVLIASDYDNTLVHTGAAFDKGRERNRMSEESRRAIRYFMEEGGIFSIATGRSYPSFNTVREEIPMNGPTILFNGAAIFDYEKNRYLYQAFLRETARDHVMQVVKEYPGVACEIYHDDSSIHVLQPNRWSEDHLNLTHSTSVTSRNMDPDQVPAPMSKALFEADEITLRGVAEYIRSQPWGDEYEIVFSNVYLLEMTAKGATKGGMVRKLSEILHIEPQHVYCMGDQANDVDMLEISAIPFAPENAIEAVHQIEGIHILPPCWNNTVVAAIEQLSRRYPLIGEKV